MPGFDLAAAKLFWTSDIPLENEEKEFRERASRLGALWSCSPRVPEPIEPAATCAKTCRIATAVRQGNAGLLGDVLWRLAAYPPGETPEVADEAVPLAEETL